MCTHKDCQLTGLSNGDVSKVEFVVVVDEGLRSRLEAQRLLPADCHTLCTSGCADAGIGQASVTRDSLLKRLRSDIDKNDRQEEESKEHRVKD